MICLIHIWLHILPSHLSKYWCNCPTTIYLSSIIHSILCYRWLVSTSPPACESLSLSLSFINTHPTSVRRNETNCTMWTGKNLMFYEFYHYASFLHFIKNHYFLTFQGIHSTSVGVDCSSQHTHITLWINSGCVWTNKRRRRSKRLRKAVMLMQYVIKLG